MKNHIMSTVFISLISVTAQAGTAAVIPFNDLDANHDDGVSAAEAGALADISAQWNALDENGDGRLSRAEYAAYQLPAPAAGTR